MTTITEAARQAPTEFDFLLNAFEQATKAERPADHDYAAKRCALFAYVSRLAVGAARPAAPVTAPAEGSQP